MMPLFKKNVNRHCGKSMHGLMPDENKNCGLKKMNAPCAVKLDVE